MRERFAPAFARIFENGDALGAPFQESVTRRVVVFPIPAGLLYEAQFLALFEAAAQRGDQELLLSAVDHFGLIEGSSEHWVIGAHDWPTYGRSDFIMLTSAMYSPAGTWGLMTSYENSAMLGGDDAFVNAFLDRLPPLWDILRKVDPEWLEYRPGELDVDLPEREAEMLALWLRAWNDGHPERHKWLPRQLTHMYGQPVADQLLATFIEEGQGD
jgi:hypothetical protein